MFCWLFLLYVHMRDEHHQRTQSKRMNNKKRVWSGSEMSWCVRWSGICFSYQRVFSEIWCVDAHHMFASLNFSKLRPTTTLNVEFIRGTVPWICEASRITLMRVDLSFFHCLQSSFIPLSTQPTNSDNSNIILKILNWRDMPAANTQMFSLLNFPRRRFCFSHSHIFLMIMS